MIICSKPPTSHIMFAYLNMVVAIYCHMEWYTMARNLFIQLYISNDMYISYIYIHLICFNYVFIWLFFMNKSDFSTPYQWKGISQYNMCYNIYMVVHSVYDIKYKYVTDIIYACLYTVLLSSYHQTSPETKKTAPNHVYQFFVWGNLRLVSLSFNWSPLENILKTKVQFAGPTP